MVIQGLNGYSDDAANQWQISAVPPGDVADQGVDQGDCPAAGTASAPGASTLQGCGDTLWGTGMAQSAIGGPAVLKEVTGIDDPRADAVLDQGGVVVFEDGMVSGGKITLVVRRQVTDKAKPATATVTTTYVTLPAIYENPAGLPNPGLVISPAAAQRTGLAAGGNLSLVLDLRSHITANQGFVASEAISQFIGQSGLMQEDGYVSKLGLANFVLLGVALLLAIGAAGIATGLALADGRADQETLAAVGASPWTRRWLAGSTALVITGLGVLIGVPLGFAIAEGLVRVSNLSMVVGVVDGQAGGPAKPFTVPWFNLGVCAFAIPAVTALCAMLLSRSKAPAARRVEF
jgi:putative ABC transport system permease protein